MPIPGQYPDDSRTDDSDQLQPDKNLQDVAASSEASGTAVKEGDNGRHTTSRRAEPVQPPFSPSHHAEASAELAILRAMFREKELKTIEERIEARLAKGKPDWNLDTFRYRAPDHEVKLRELLEKHVVENKRLADRLHALEGRK